MKTITIRPTSPMLATLVRWTRPLGAVAVAGMLSAQEAVPFRSGSTGADGELDITANTTLDLPPDGVLHCTTINIASGATLRFNRNAANTPVYLLATGPVTVSGSINLNGEQGQVWGQGGAGGPGGFDGGNTTPRLQPGQGPGGGRSNILQPASHATVGGSTHTNIYGDPLLLSLVGGSGGAAVSLGGSNRGGGGGGGAILIASDVSIQVTGAIHARGNFGGGPANENTGSGGAIRLVAPSVTGTGQLWVESVDRWANGVGRVRIDSLNRTGIDFNHRAVYAAGANLIARLPVEPTLRIVHAAGQDIPTNALGVVRVILPNGTPATQPVRIQARGFNAAVPIRVTLYPENADPIQIDDVIDNTQGETAVRELTPTFPPNTPTRIHVWTRSAN